MPNNKIITIDSLGTFLDQIDARYGASISLSIDSTYYKLTATLKDVNGTTLATSNEIDLPLESIITSATFYSSYTYDGTTYTNVIVLVLATTSTPTIIPVGNLISGLVNTSDLNTALAGYLPLSGGTLTANTTPVLMLKRNAVSGGAFVGFENNNQTSNIWYAGADSSGNFRFSYSSDGGLNSTKEAQIDTSGNIYEGNTKLSDKYLALSGGNMIGHIYLTGAVANSSTSNTSQIVFGTSSNNHVALSSNAGSLIINPSTGSTTGQIIMQVGSEPFIEVGGNRVAYTSQIPSSLPANGGNADTLDGYHASSFLTSHQSVTNQDATLAWSTRSKIATIGSTDIYVTMPANPDTDSNTWRPINVNGSSAINDTSTTVNFTGSGSTSVSYSDGTITISSPSSLPASDVYSWAKQSTKPSYNYSEIEAGNIVQGNGSGYILWRNDATYNSGIYYSTPSEEAVVFANKNLNGNYSTQWLFAYTNPTDRTNWGSLTNTVMQIKKDSVAINKLVGTNVPIPYNLDVNGSANATTVTINTKATLQYNSNEDCLDFVFA